ncbi:MAG: DUF4386 family protein [Burkholderiales bacterium]|nr:DUF4386 family protein [Burkholderiales bacterium]
MRTDVRANLRIHALLAFLAGGLSLVLLLASVVPPPGDPAQPLAWEAGHRSAYALVAALALTWSVLSVPFAITLGAMIEDADASLVTAARFLTAGGILLLGTGVFLGFAALLALGAAGPAPDPAVVAHHARFWAQMRYLLTDPGLMAWGVGLLLYGGLLWRSGALPRSVVAICLAGGVAGVLTLAVFETSILALVQLVAFAVLGLGAGVSLLRESRGTAGAPR